MGTGVHRAEADADAGRPQGEAQGEPGGEGATATRLAHPLEPLARLARRFGGRRALAPAEHDRQGAGDEGLCVHRRGGKAVRAECEAMTLERPEVEPPEGDIPFELGIDDITAGDGDEAVAGKTVTVHYVGVAFRTGEEFDASWNRGEPFRFKLGKGQVIPGWDQGVQGMKVGGCPRPSSPSAVAYGARGAGWGFPPP